MAAMMTKENVTKAEAAAMLGVSLNTLHRILTRGELPFTKPSPRRVVIRSADVAAYVAARTGGAR